MSDSYDEGLVYFCIFILFLTKHFIIDKIIYKLSKHNDFPVADKALKRVYLPLKLWRRYYFMTWVAFGCFLPVAFLWIFLLILGDHNIIEKVLIFLAFILFFYVPIYIWRKHLICIKFKSFSLDFSPDKAYEILQDKQKQTGWDVIAKEPNKFMQVHVFGPHFSRGELVTLIFVGNELLINSIASPYKKISSSTNGNNKINIDYFFDLLSKEN